MNSKLPDHCSFDALSDAERQRHQVSWVRPGMAVGRVIKDAFAPTFSPVRSIKQLQLRRLR